MTVESRRHTHPVAYHAGTLIALLAVVCLAVGLAAWAAMAALIVKAIIQ